MPIPVQIFAGFLGAGKTTAIGAQLGARPGERVAVIVNDFGEASLDESTLAESEPFRITNIPGGCVCCTAPEGFVDALGAVLEENPDRLLIERLREKNAQEPASESRDAAGGAEEAPAAPSGETRRESTPPA